MSRPEFKPRIFGQRTRLWVIWAILVAWGVIRGAGAESPEFAAFAEQIQQARSEFRQVTEADLELATGDVRQALAGVEKIFASSPQKLRGWQQYLSWPDQIEQLTSAEPNAVFWREIFHRVARNEEGLERPEFQNYRRSLRALIDVTEAMQHPNLAEEFEQTLDEMAEIVGSDATARDSQRLLTEDLSAEDLSAEDILAEDIDRLSTLLSRLHRRRQVPGLVADMRRSFDHANLIVEVSDAGLRQIASRDVERDLVIHDLFRGAVVRGTGRFSATQTMSLPSRNQNGHFRLQMRGTTTSETASRQQGVTVRNYNFLTFQTAARLELAANGLTLLTGQTKATLRSDLLHVSTDFGTRLREKRAREIVKARQAEDRAAAERKAIKDLEVAFQSELSTAVATGNRRYVKSVRHPLMRHDRFPSVLEFSSNAAVFRLQSVLANDYELAAPANWPKAPENAEVTILVHQSAFNNTIGAMLASRKMSLGSAFGQHWLSADTIDEERDSMSIEFADSSPIQVLFQDGHVHLAYSGAHYSKQGQCYSGMDILLQYRIEQQDGQFWLVQAEPPAVVLPKGPDGKRRRLGIRDYTLRRILKNVIAKELPDRTSLSSISLPSPLDALDAVDIVHLEMQNGWLCLCATQRR